MNPNIYAEFLTSIDIAYFSTDRQSSIFTTISMLSRGVKVIMKSSVSPYKFYSKNGIKVYDLYKQQSLHEILSLDSDTLFNNSLQIQCLWSTDFIFENAKLCFNSFD